MNRTDIDDTLRDMWSTRPVRRRDDRKIAGVAAAIARRYRIDPILVRIALVVATIYGGVGILIYLLGWLLLPQEGDEVSAAEALFGQGTSSMSKPLTVVLGIALIPASSQVFTGHLGAVFALFAISAALYLLHRSRPGVPATSAPGLTGFDATTVGFGTTPGAATVASSATASGTTTATGEGRQEPPAWDPLGVAPFAWDLPEPTPVAATPEPEPPAPKPRRRRSPVTPVTLALALMTAGVGSIVALTNSGVGPSEVAALTLGVVGIGLVVGAFVRGGRGLIAVAIPLAIATYALSVASLDRFDGVGDRRWEASTVSEVQPEYRLSAGDARLDLSSLDLTGTDRVRTAVHIGTGQVRVLVPADADVEVKCHANVGHLNCLGSEEEGPQPRVEKTDLGEDGAGGGTIVLEVSAGAGDLEVSRG